jgi:hypothetical protein
VCLGQEIQHYNTLLQPGKSAGSLGGPPWLGSRLDQLTVVSRDHVPHSYSAADQAKLRLSIFSYDRFGWFDDGLRYLPKDPKTFPAAGQACDAERIEAADR